MAFCLFVVFIMGTAAWASGRTDKTHVLRVAIAIRKWLRVPESHSKLSALIQFQETLAGSYITPENGQQKTL